MSNSFTSPPTLADETTVVAGQPIGEGAVTLMSQTANYLWSTGGTHNCLSQAWAEGQFNQKGLTYQPMVEYVIPILSRDHYDLHIHFIALGPGGIRSTLTIGASSYTDEVLSTGAGPHVIESTITVTSTPSQSYGVLSIEVKHTSGTPNHHEIRSLAAHWVAKASPVSTGAQADGLLNTFTPFGINRVGNDYPLSSRWGVNMLENIETLRRRPMVYASWSGVDNLNAAPVSDTDPAPALYVGVGDMEVLYSPVYIPHEAFEGGNFYTITVWLNVVNIGVIDSSVTYVIMGQEITVTTNGWSSYQITVRPDQDEDMSQAFNLSIYRAGFENDQENWLSLVSISRNATSAPLLPYVKGFVMWGI
jgi:hypothetical protein